MLTSLKKILQILTRQEKTRLVLLLLISIAMALLQALGVASVLPFIALVLDPDLFLENRWVSWVYNAFNFSTTNSFLIFTGLTIFLIILLSNAITALVAWLKLKFALLNKHRLSKLLLEKYLSMPYAYFLNRNSADLSNNILNEVSQLTYGYILPVLTIFTRSLTSLFILVMLFLIDLWVTLFALILIGGIYAAIYNLANRKIEQDGAERLQASDKSYKSISEAFGGIKEIKVTNRENYFRDSYSSASFKLVSIVSRHTVVSMLPRFALEIIASGGIIAFVLILILTREDAARVLPLAGLFAIAGYRLMPAIQEVFGAFVTMKFYQSVLNRIYSDLTEGINTDYLSGFFREELPVPQPFNRDIRLQNITYAYPQTNLPVLHDVNLVIKHDSSIAFIGPTGAGKTTLVDIILGLLVPTEGLLLVDGVPIDHTNIVNWQRNIGYVPQHIYLSDDTIIRNIAFGIPDHQIDQQAIETAARMANIDQFINEELPQGYETMVGERGIRLSGGQLQRIGIARALYHNPALIVFDEATSALDGASEDLVLSALDKASRHKTLIIIAHRLTTVRKCDQLYLVERGKITANGTYEELQKTNARFQKMNKVRG